MHGARFTPLLMDESYVLLDNMGVEAQAALDGHLVEQQFLG